MPRFRYSWFGYALGAFAVTLIVVGCQKEQPAQAYRPDRQYPAPTPLTDEQARMQAYAFLDSFQFGYLDGQFVATELGFRGMASPHGFLNPKTHEIIGTNLYPRGSGGYPTGSGWPRDTKPVDFIPWVTKNLNGLVSPSISDRLPEANLLDLIVLSEVADHRGRKDLAQRLFAGARSIEFGASQTKQSADVVLDRLKGEVASVNWTGVESTLFDPKVSRPQVVAKIDQYLAVFPSAAPSKRAKELRDRLWAQVQLDRQHPPLPPDATQEQRIADEIYHLEDYTATPGPSISDSWAETDQPTRLDKEGMDAVPGLIDALSDHRLARAPDLFGQPRPSLGVMEVRQVAIQILQRIAGQNFLSSWQGRITDKNEAKVRAQVQAWWSDAHLGDEANALEEALRSGKANVSEAAMRLSRQFPGRALSAVIAGYPKMVEPYQKSAAISFVANARNAEGNAFLMSVMESDPSETNRCEAASALVDVDKPAVLRAMIRDLDATSDSSRWQSPAYVLTQTGDPQAFDVLRARVARFSLQALASLLTYIDPEGVGAGWSYPRLRGNPPKADPQVLAAVEDFAATNLTDTRKVLGFMFRHADGSGSSTSNDGPRICDLASQFLATKLKAGYRYRDDAPSTELEADRLYNLKLWQTRRSNGRKANS